jgi:hypothetical protein
MQYCGIAVLCLIGKIIDPYYQKRLTRYSTDQSCPYPFQQSQAGENFRKKA